MAKARLETAPEGAKPSGRYLEVTSREHRRRAGRAFGPEPVRIPVEDLDEETLATLLADTSLSCRPVEGEPEAPAEQTTE